MSIDTKIEDDDLRGERKNLERESIDDIPRRAIELTNQKR